MNLVKITLPLETALDYRNMSFCNWLVEKEEENLLRFNTKGGFLNITQFAKSHNIKYENVSMFISRHKKMFEGHISTVGKFRYLDDKAIEILEKGIANVSGKADYFDNDNVYRRLYFCYTYNF